MNSPRSPKTPLSSELKKIINDRNVLTMRSRMKVLNSLNEGSRKEFEERERNLRYQATQEILTSEVTYLRQLEILMEYFIEPMIDKRLLHHALLSTLLENIKTLYNVSGELIKELRKNLQNIAAAFHKLAPFFKLYSVYAYDYEQVLSLIQTAQENDPALKDFIGKQETRPEVGRKLPSLLITPIQRVPRYKLLLKEVLQHTPNRHKEYSLLQACLVEVEKAARHINSLVEQNEETRKLLRLQKCIVNPINLVKPGRKLIKQGALMRVSRKGNSAYRRYFVLLSDTLLYCKGDPDSSLTVCCVLPLNKCRVETVLSGGLFRVTCLEETLLLYSEREDSNLWIDAIKNSIKKYAECRQTLRKDSSSRKPLRHHNVNLFPSENIPRASGKRKRSEEDAEIILDASTIVYFKKDNEEDVDVPPRNKCLLLLNKIKRLKGSNDQKCIESYVQNVKLPLPNIDENSDNSFVRQIHRTNNSRENGVNVANKENLEEKDSSEEKVGTTFETISGLFSYIGSSIKGLFKFR